MPLRAVTFDFHNTLASCDEWFDLEIRSLVPAFLEWRGSHVGEVTSPELRDATIVTYRELRQEIIHHGEELDAVACVEEVLRRHALSVPRAEIEAGVDELMTGALSTSRPTPGAVETVQSLRQAGLRLGIVSAAVHHGFLEWSLDAYGILDAFDAIVTSASAGYYKSRTEIYEHVLERLDTPAELSVHVGDSHRWDIEVAHRAGMKTVWITSTDASGNGVADLTAPTLEGLAATILRRFG